MDTLGSNEAQSEPKIWPDFLMKKIDMFQTVET